VDSAAAVFRVVPSPIGELLLARASDGLRGLWVGGEREPDPAWPRDDAAFDDVVRELDAYFAGTLERFTIPLAPVGTPFQRAVWAALVAIPYGAVTTYAALAASIGRPTAIRAVGAANGANPLSVIVPCHRVVGSDGSLTGYGGGLPAKRWLLDHEARPAARP
jgi:methylated-DNA-[protein]-cysteine S-methyltransferase